MRRTWTTSIALSVLAVLGPVQAAQERIPDVLAREGRSLTASAPPPSGFFGEASIDSLLEVTDVIVRGHLTNPRSYLSSDQTMVLTDFNILNPEYLYAATALRRGLPLPRSVTFKGGTVTIDGLTYTAQYKALSLPQPGTEVLLLLRWVDERYYVAGEYYGVLGISGGRLEGMAHAPHYVAAYINVPAAEAIAALVSRRLQLGR